MLGDIGLQSRIQYTYVPLANRVLANNGHGLQVDGDFGILRLPSGSYEVNQFHVHFPSEHSIDGAIYAGELHIVHQKTSSNSTNDLAFVSIMLNTTDDFASIPKGGFFQNLGFEALDTPLPDRYDPKNTSKHVDLNVFQQVLRGHYAHDFGSLTTPPCSETVQWFVMLDPFIISRSVIQEFTALHSDAPSPHNRRPLQPLNGRVVFYDDLIGPGDTDLDGFHDEDVQNITLAIKEEEA